MILSVDFGIQLPSALRSVLFYTPVPRNCYWAGMMTRVNGVGGLKAIFFDTKKSIAQKSLLTAFARKVAQITHPKKHTVSSLSTDKTIPNKKLPTRAISPHTLNNTKLPPPQKQSVYQNYERISQQLTDLTSIQRFKKDLLIGYSAGNLNGVQFSKLSGKVTSAVFKLVRQGQVANLSLQVLRPLVGDDKAKEVMKSVDTQQTTRLNTLKWGAAQNSQKLYQTLSDKSHKLNTFREAIDFKKELLARTAAKELPSDKFQKLHTDALVPALKKLSQKPEQAKQMTYKRLELLVGNSQAANISQMCKKVLQKSDQQLLRNLKNLPAPPDGTPPAT